MKYFFVQKYVYRNMFTKFIICEFIESITLGNLPFRLSQVVRDIFKCTIELQAHIPDIKELNTGGG